MRLLRIDLDHHSYERVHIGEFHPTSNICPVLPFAARDRTGMVPGTQRSQQGDVVLKCLHRDDPLRHTYLRRRWRAT